MEHVSLSFLFGFIVGLAVMVHIADADDYSNFDWDAFDNLTLSDVGDGEADNISNNSICTDVAGITDAFEVADDIALRSRAWTATPKKGRYKAYVVFNGRQMGVFQMWSVSSYLEST